MEGLEQLPGDQWQKHLEETESRLSKEFSIGQDNRSFQRIALSLIGLFVTSLLATWYFTTGTQDTVDLSPTPKETVSTAANTPLLAETTEINSATVITPEDSSSQIETKVVVKKQPVKEPVRNIPNSKTSIAQPAKRNKIDAVTHITVGRIVDTRGIAIPNALVTSGKVSDTTDKSGYYALKIAKGGTQILVTHLATNYFIEIDTNQNWEIVLDIVQQKVHDYHPMNAANRFK